MGKIQEALDKYRINESTRSNVGIEDKDGKVKYVYVHNDGYLKGVGATLKKNYKDPKKVSQLIALGGLSIIGKDIGKKHSFDGRGSASLEMMKTAEWKDWTLAYNRDRGEPKKIYTAKSRDEFIEEAGMVDYLYMYSVNDKKWYWTRGDKWEKV